MTISFETKSINLSQGTISYLEGLRAKSSILFIHGNNGAKEAFVRQFEGDLAENYRLMALDLPGHGASDRPEGDYFLEAFAQCVVEFCQKLELGRPFLVGHSLGGHIAIQVSQKMELAGLVICQTPPLQTAEDLFRGLNPVEAISCLFQAQLSSDEKKAVAKVYASEAFLQSQIEKWIDACDPRFRESFQAALASYTYGEVDIVRNLKIPFACIGASKDVLTNGAYIREIVGDANYFEIECTSHYPHFEQSEAFNQKLLDFVRGNE